MNHKDEYAQIELEDEHEDLSPDFRSKTHLGMRTKDARDLESNLRRQLSKQSTKRR